MGLGSTQSVAGVRRARRGLRAAGTAVTLCLIGSASVLAETPAGLARYAGNYVYAGTRGEGIEIVEKAVDKAMRDQNMVIRAMAKRAFSEHFATTVLIEVGGGRLGIKVGDLNKAPGELDKTQTVKGADGREGRLTYRFEDDAIVSTLIGDEATIRTVFTLSSDGKSLKREVRVQSSKLSKPLSYRLEYKRK